MFISYIIDNKSTRERINIMLTKVIEYYRNYTYYDWGSSFFNLITFALLYSIFLIKALN